MQATRIVRRSSLVDLTGLSMSTIYRLIAQGRFPAPVRLSDQAVGWNLSEVNEWIDGRSSVRH